MTVFSVSDDSSYNDSQVSLMTVPTTTNCESRSAKVDIVAMETDEVPPADKT